jgi:cytochrome b561
MPDAEAAAAVAPRYDGVARAVHWLVAALAVIAVALGLVIAWAPRNTPQRDLVLLLHRSVGLTIFAAMVFRAGWRWRHPPPPLPSGLARLEVALARLTHFILYLILIVMPIAGYLNAAAAGHAVSLFGFLSIPPLLPEDDRLSQIAIAIHLVGQYPLYLFVTLHLAGALLHGAVKRDGIIERMLPVIGRYSASRSPRRQG